MNRSVSVDIQPHEHQIYHERLRMFCDQICVSSPSYFYWIAALAGILWFADSNMVGMIAWILSATAIEFAKLRVLKSFLGMDEVADLSTWEWRIAGAMFSEGLVVSAGVALLLNIHESFAFFTAMFLICATAYTSAMYHIASLRTYYAWATALLVPWAIKLLMSDNQYYWIVSAIMVVGSLSYIPVAAKVLHKHMVEALRLRYENLDLLGIAENERNNAYKANAEKTRFLASASHDLRQPMQAMSLYIEVLSQRLKKPANIEVLESLRDSHSSMGRIMDALLDISKLDAGVIEPNLEPIRLNMLIDHLIRDYSLIARKKNIELRVRSTCPDVQSDLVMLERILINLISNAICYTESHGKILVACRCRKGKALVEVWDTGIGIPEDQLEKIFDEFHQLGNPERDRSKGLGLGLSIVNRMVHLLPDHKIEVSSRPGHGSRFRITLPKAETIEATSAPAGFVLEHESFAGMRVLMLEDDAAILKSAVILMHEWGCEVKPAGSADEALSLVKAGWTPDALIADYRLPGDATGLQSIQEMRALSGKQIPAVIMTGETQEETLQEIADSGIVMLQKPVTPAKLKLFLKQSRP